MSEQPHHLAPGPPGMPPRALIVTIYGMYARELGGWMSVSSLIKLMVPLGIEGSGVRSSISRLKRRGILVAETLDGAAGYALSDRAKAILNEGDRRIFERPRSAVKDGWLVAVFSVPESEREKRYQLRSRLSWLGFGTVSSGVWIAPAHIEAEARDVLETSGLSEFVDLFRAAYMAFRPESEQVAAWWDLERLERLYDDFVSVYEPALMRWRQRDEDEPAAFAEYVQVLTHWRRLPYLDPGLSPTLLPENWLGSHAADIFFDLNERLAPAAQRHVEAVTRIGRSESKSVEPKPRLRHPGGDQPRSRPSLGTLAD